MLSKNDTINRTAGLAVLLLLGFMAWGGRSLWDSSEARYGQVALEMLTSGNWLLPTLAGEPHLSKPPFAYWMIAAGMRLWGPNAWGARFFLALFFTGTLLCIRALAQTMGYPRRTAWWAALIFGTSLLPFAGGHVLTTDAFLTFWETLGVLAAWKVWQSHNRPPSLWRLVFWGAFGMAFFTKGPPGWLALAAMAVFYGLRRDPRRPALWSAPGFVLFLGLAFWWYAVVIAQDPSRLAYFVGDELVGRVASTMHHRNEPFWIYGPLILVGVGPWMILWPATVARTWARVRKGLGTFSDRHLFMGLWFALPLAVFTLARSRMPLYIMPLFVPLALVMADIWTTRTLPRLRARPKRLRLARCGLALWILLLAVFTAYPDSAPGSRSRRPVARAFAGILKGVEGPYRIYWVKAGRQKYGIPFYLHTTVYDAARFDRHRPDAARPHEGAGERVFYITRARLLPSLTRSADPPVVRARTPDYALIEWPQEQGAAERTTPADGTRQVTSPRAPRAAPLPHFSAQRGGFLAALLLMLADGRR